jgi:hypothetical protein
VAASPRHAFFFFSANSAYNTKSFSLTLQCALDIISMCFPTEPFSFSLSSASISPTSIFCRRSAASFLSAFPMPHTSCQARISHFTDWKPGRRLRLPKTKCHNSLLRMTRAVKTSTSSVGQRFVDNESQPKFPKYTLSRLEFQSVRMAAK